jgi:hypothetical protein
MKIPTGRFLKPVTEFLILAALGLIAVIEGLRLEYTNRPKGVYDRIGAGNFLLGIGVALLLVAGAYFYCEMRECRSRPCVPKTPPEDTEKPKTMAVIITVGLTVLNILLIPILGYLVPAMIFFVLNFTIFKLTKSQPLNVIIGIGVGITFFVLFQHALGMFFPTGMFGLDFGVK